MCMCMHGWYMKRAYMLPPMQVTWYVRENTERADESSAPSAKTSQD